MSDASERYVPTGDLLCQELDGEMVLLNPQSATYFSLNGIGTSVWRLLTERRTVDEICAALATDHADAADRIRSDVTTFIADLLQAGLIRPSA